MVDNIIEPAKMWDYRVVRKTSEDGNEWYSIQEVYYDDDGKPSAQTIDLMIEGDTIAGMRTQLERMINCLGEPVLDEMVSEITEQSIENRVLGLEMENAELKDRLSELGDEMEERGL